MRKDRHPLYTRAEWQIQMPADLCVVAEGRLENPQVTGSAAGAACGEESTQQGSGTNGRKQRQGARSFRQFPVTRQILLVIDATLADEMVTRHYYGDRLRGPALRGIRRSWQGHTWLKKGENHDEFEEKWAHIHEYVASLTAQPGHLHPNKWEGALLLDPWNALILES
jgi:hypothetical protein